MKLPLLLASLENNATSFSSGIAIITDSANWSYEQLWSLVGQFEVALEETAIPAQSTVAVTAYKTVDTLALILALGKRGHTPLAVSPGLGSTVKPIMYSTAGVYCELSAERRPDCPLITVVSRNELQPDAFPDVMSVDSCPLMLTTSGSTGLPKVVKLSAEGVSAFFHWGAEYFHLRKGSRVLSYAPLNFDLSLLEIWTPLVQGATVILADTDRATLSEYLKTLVCDYRPDLIQAVPMFYTLLCPETDAQDWVMDGSCHVVFTGDTTPQELRKRVAIKFPEATFHNIYGCTETNDSFVYSADARAIVQDERLPLGRPIAGVTFHIMTEDGKKLVGAGEGELFTSTPFTAHGYTDPELTIKALFVEPSDGRTYYRTGDRVSRDESGQLTLLGRNDFIVKVRGVRTNTLDIEQVLLKMPEVKNAVVIPVNDDIAGVVLHAVLVLIQGQTLDGIPLRMLCAQYLPHTSIPRRFHFREGALPVTSTGKPDRKSIALSIQPQGSKSA